jgi:hypothetical protein
MFELKTIDQLVRIAHAGGGFRLEAALKETNDLVKIAFAAGNSGAKITFAGLNLRSVDDIIRISHAGKGNVSFEESNK